MSDRQESTFEVPGTLPSLNDYIRAERANRYAAASIKHDAQDRIRACLGDVPSFEGAVRVEFTWIRPDMRTDPDNVAFAKKFILDALQAHGILEKNSWKLCRPYDVGFYVNKANPRTVVRIVSEQPHA